MGAMTEDPRWLYRQIVDAMVVSCADAGQVSAQRIRTGVWNSNADDAPDAPVEQHDMNVLLAGLSPDHRETLAALFAEEFASGIFNALEVLRAARLPGFEQGYEGAPSDDFLSRMDGQEWPRSVG